jgi:hypothetical protein
MPATGIKRAIPRRDGSQWSKNTTDLGVGSDFDDRFALVRPAVGANVMHDVILAAVFAADEVVQRERVMGAPFIAAAPGMSSFWQRTHRITPLTSPVAQQIRGNPAARH